jgi:hypothetical protein
MNDVGEILKNEKKCSVFYRYAIICYEWRDFLVAEKVGSASEMKLALADLMTMIDALAWQIGVEVDWGMPEDRYQDLSFKIFDLARLLSKKYRYGRKDIDADLQRLLSVIAAKMKGICYDNGWDYNELQRLGLERLKEKIAEYNEKWLEV